MKSYALILLAFLPGLSLAGKILFLFPISFRSHYKPFEPLILELANRGHQVVTVSPWAIPNAPSNVKEIGTYYDTKDFVVDLFRNVDPVALRASFVTNLKFHVGPGRKILLDACRAIYQRQDIMALLEEAPRFDLVFVESPLADCMLGFVHRLEAPFVQYSVTSAPSIAAAAIGNRLPLSFVPHVNFPGTFSLSFWNRCLNVVYTAAFDVVFKFVTSQDFWSLQSEFLGKDVPSWHQIMSDMSMFFVNSDFLLQHHKPVLADMLHVSGMQCRPAEALPEDLEDFVSGATNGLILFSLGSIVAETQMPNHTRTLFLNVFSRLEQRVLWKWESEQMPGEIPANVKLQQWVPQQDVLGHPNTKLFISHGGLLSMQESVYHGKPMIMLPFFWDHDVNAGTACTAGMAEKLEISDLTEEMLMEAINLVLRNSSYTENARRLSILYRDQPQTALSSAVFWSEYIMRHNGAEHLRSPARELNFVQYYCLDAMAAFGILAMVVLWLLKLMVVKVVSEIVLRRASGSKRKQKLI